MKKHYLNVSISPENPEEITQTYYYKTMSFNGELFAITRYIENGAPTTDGWTLTHIPTGLKALPSIPYSTQADVFEAANRLIPNISLDTFHAAIARHPIINKDQSHD